MSVTVRKGSRLYGIEQRNALEVFLLTFVILTGLVALFRPFREAVPAFLQVAWNATLILGGATSLVGMFWHEAITGILITRAGLIVTGTMAYLYAIPIWWVGGPYATMVVAIFGIAAHTRAWQISRQLDGRT